MSRQIYGVETCIFLRAETGPSKETVRVDIDL